MLEKAVELASLQAESDWSMANSIRKKDRSRFKRLANIAKELGPNVESGSTLGR